MNYPNKWLSAFDEQRLKEKPMNFRNIDMWFKALEEKQQLARHRAWLSAALVVSNLCWLAFVIKILTSR